MTPKNLFGQNRIDIQMIIFYFFKNNVISYLHTYSGQDVLKINIPARCLLIA
jgi:hypothetical protein